jgi:DNA repair exonuclease SbcCD nuclease subunit
MIYAAADLHLTELVWKSRRELFGDSFKALDRLATSIIADELPTGETKHVILAGDVLDTQKISGHTLQAFTTFVDRLYEHSIPVYYIIGNHDVTTLSALGIQGAIPLHQKITEMDGRKIYGLDWMPREHLKEAVQTVPECDILVLHCMFEHMINFEASCDLSLEEIPPTVKNIIVGDIHITKKVDFRKHGVCISPGALHPCNISQGGAHGFYKLAQGSAEWVFQAIPTRNIHRYALETSEELSQALEELNTIEVRSEELKDLVEITYKTDLNAEVDKMLEALKSKFIFFRNPNSTGKMLSSEDLKKVQLDLESISPIEGLSTFVSQEEEPEVYALLSNILSSATSASDILEQFINQEGEKGDTIKVNS